MDKEKEDGNDEGREVAPTKARPIIFQPGGQTLGALSRLRGVREVGGKRRLGLMEAVDVALKQGEAFERWSAKGTPIGRVQVWVESHLMMTVYPEEGSVRLKAFNFNVASARDAVMQIVTADRGEEQVVLRNLPLSTVPAFGLVDTTPLPNGQSIKLEIVPKENGRFDIQVDFVTEEDLSRPVLRPEKLRVKPIDKTSTFTSQRSYVPTLLAQPRGNNWLWPFATALTAIVACSIYVWGGRAIPNSQPVVAARDNNSPTTSGAKRVAARRSSAVAAAPKSTSARSGEVENDTQAETELLPPTVSQSKGADLPSIKKGEQAAAQMEAATRPMEVASSENNTNSLAKPESVVTVTNDSFKQKDLRHNHQPDTAGCPNMNNSMRGLRSDYGFGKSRTNGTGFGMVRRAHTGP